MYPIIEHSDQVLSIVLNTVLTRSTCITVPRSPDTHDERGYLSDAREALDFGTGVKDGPCTQALPLYSPAESKSDHWPTAEKRLSYGPEYANIWVIIG